MRVLALLAPLAGLAAPAASALDFTTPSRNIGCAGDATFVRCDISQTRAKPPPTVTVSS